MNRQTPEAHPASSIGIRDWMSMGDFCNELHVSSSTAYKWSAAGTSSGRFPRYRKLPNGSIRIRRDWFDEWVESLDQSA